MIKNRIFNSCLVGQGSLLIKCAEILLEKKHVILGIVSSDVEVINWGKAQSIPCYLSISEFESKVIKKSFDFLFSIVNPNILSSETIQFARQLSINYHDSLLPAYAGVHATSWAILNGETTHGVSWHIVESQLDAGNTLKQAIIPIASDETALSLNLKCFEKAAELFVELVDELATQKYHQKKQDLHQRSYYASYKKPSNDGFINWCDTAENLARYCQALYFGDYPNRLAIAKIYFKKQIFIIPTIQLTKVKSTSPPGTIVKISRKNLQISTSNLDILICNFYDLRNKKYSIPDFVQSYKIEKNDHFKIFSIQEKSNLQKIGEDFGKHENFWLNELLNIEVAPQLPALPLLVKQDQKPYVFSLVIEQEENFLQRISGIAGQSISWLDAVLVTWLIYLYRINPTLSEGYTVGWNAQYVADFEKNIGFYFAKYIPLTVNFNPSVTLIKAFKDILCNFCQIKKKHTFKVDIFSRYPSLSRSEQQWQLESIPIVIEVVSSLENFNPDGRVDITIAISETEHKCAIFQNVKKSRDQSQLWLENVAGHINTLLISMTKLTSQQFKKTPIAYLPILTDSEYILVTQKWNNSAEKYVEKRSIPKLFEEQVVSTPAALAVISEGCSITYKELNNKANQLGHYLLNQGVKPENVVTVCMESGVDFITAILAIMKINAIYVPVSTSYPDPRIQRIIIDSESVYILSQYSKKPTFEAISLKLPIVYIDNTHGILEKLSDQNIKLKTIQQNNACIIYTSGSTGEPKGVSLRHDAIISRIKKTNYVRFQSSDRVAQIANIAFDATIFEIFGALLNGAQLHIISKEVVLSPKQFSRTLHKKKISLMFVTASLFQQTLLSAPSAFDGVHQLLCGGEICDVYMAHKLILRKNKKRLPVKLINSYGPTETTIFSVTHEVTLDDIKRTTVPIGKPITNSRIFIVDEREKLLPIGVKGELYIAGIGVSAGYINQPQLNKKNFLQFHLQKNKFVKVYRTGDIVRWLPEGIVEYIGRKDTQVKIRGFRVELSEIKNRLCQYKGIETAIVISKKDKAGYSNHLVAYIICDEKISSLKIRRYMLLHLPDYMVPAFFIKIDKIPLTANGKIAINELPDLEVGDLSFSRKYVAPINSKQEILQKIWSKVLRMDVKNISIHDNFFLLGGHSLQAAKVASEVLKNLSAKISIADIFENQTIAMLSKKITLKIQNKAEEGLPVVVLSTTENNIPLSLAQKRIEIIQNLVPDSPAYNIPRLISVKGNLDVNKLSEAICKIVQRHAVLRTNFLKKCGDTYQKINPIEDLDRFIEIINAENFGDLAMRDCIYKAVNRPFNLKDGPLLKIQIYKKSSQDFLVLFCFHHIIFDGWSLDCFYKELSIFYRSRSKNNRSIKSLEKQYADFSIWQANLPYESFFQPAENYWKKQLTGLKPLSLPTDYERPPLQTFRGQHIQFTISTALSRKLRTLAKNEKTSLFSLFLSSFSILLYRYCYQQDFTIGIPFANRENELSKGMIGCFINTLAIRCDLSKNIPYTSYLEQIKKTLLEAHRHNEYSLERVIEALNIKYDPKFSPLFQVIFSFNEFGTNNLRLKDLTTKSIFVNTDTAKSDLGMEVEIRGSKIIAHLEYNSDLFSNARMQQLTEHFSTLLQSITENPKAAVYTVNMLTIAERKNFAKWNDTKSKLAWHKPIHELFMEQAKKSPGNIALQFGKNKLTYQELAQKSTCLSYHLHKLGVTQGKFIAISMYRSLEMVITLLAVIKNGAACVPIDPDYPSARINYILLDSASQIILTQDSLKHKFIGSEQVVVSVDAIDNVFYQPPINSKRTGIFKIAPDDIAYVIYTSGSTGKPKGVMCTHKGISNRLLWMQSAYKLTKKDTVLQKTTFCFDVSIWEFFWPLISGARLVVAKPDLHKDPGYILETIIKNNVTTIHFVPSMLQAFLAQKNVELCNGLLKRVISSGEALSAQLRDGFLQKLSSVKLYNLYGPTEASIDVTSWDCSQLLPCNRVPIGKPIANTNLYVLDACMNLVPVNVPGELYIGGIGLARGYVNNKQLTDATFVNNIFSKNSSDKLYKTGDFATWLPDGNLAFIDRIDNQVKIRGFRIELSEIENALLQFPLISQCVVIVKGEEVEKQIIAYITLNSENIEKIQPVSIKKFLFSILPEYMIPAFFITVDEMPLTDSGKVDKKSLLSKKGVVLHNKHQDCDPSSSEQIAIANILKEILKQSKLSKINMDESFFDLGGSSITALHFLSKINEQFSTDITIRDLLAAPTIREIEKLIKKNQEKTSYHFQNELLIRKNLTHQEERYVSIVPIHTDKNKPALFLFHPIGGTIFWCFPLAKYLSRYYSIYAMQDPGLEAPYLNFKNLEELVGLYVSEISRLQPSGPYLLGGFSSGANLAVEASRQLTERGQFIKFLGLIDGWALYPQEIYNYDFLKMNMLRQFREIYSKLPGNKHHDWEKIFTSQCERMKLYETHTLQKINYDISLFKAKNILPIYQPIDDPLNHWRGHGTQIIETYWIPGDHESMLQEPNVKILGEKMIQAMHSCCKQMTEG